MESLKNIGNNNHKYQTTLLLLAILCFFTQSYGQFNEDCLSCHDDPDLTDETGISINLSKLQFSESVHSDLECTDCHVQPADYDDLPHFKTYVNVSCKSCHEDEQRSFNKSVHSNLSAGRKIKVSCSDCHEKSANSHYIQPSDSRSIREICGNCHTQGILKFEKNLHRSLSPEARVSFNCISCHDEHALRETGKDNLLLNNCYACHPNVQDKFSGSIHEPLTEDGSMTCLTCHNIHLLNGVSNIESFGCGSCHQDILEDYDKSAHSLARLKGDAVAATCADCHDHHNIYSVSDPESPVFRLNIPSACARCHGDTPFVTTEFVKLPVNLPNYSTSVHGMDSTLVHEAAVCTDCHGVHDLQSASSLASSVNKNNIAETCGVCHQEEFKKFASSIHGKAVEIGIKDSPSCTDCHDEHLILHVDDPRSAVNPSNQASQTCGRCHEDLEMAARFGLPREVIATYQDSYHGWALKRGGKAVAVCMDCHNTHDIRSVLDPSSSIHKNNVVETCRKCHPNSNPGFAASYTHILARDKMLIHDWIRVVYIWMIIIVLSGMVIHNLIIFVNGLRKHYRDHTKKPAIERMNRSEIIQHFGLTVTFIGLAVTGFALRFPDSWWVKGLAVIGLNEESRRLIHRVLAFAMVAVSLYHVWYMLFTHRGRLLLRWIAPRFRDLTDALKNVVSHLKKDGEPPKYGMYDYTQKVEYWALIWGTVLMALTGFVLWFPTIATIWTPSWIVRVSEVIHFYEAILAVSAIIIWHFFFVIFLPKEYPMSWTWITGRMSKEEWQRHHALEKHETGIQPKEIKPGNLE